MADVADLRVRLVEHIRLFAWDHDCPTMHGGRCPPLVLAEETRELSKEGGAKDAIHVLWRPAAG